MRPNHPLERQLSSKSIGGSGSGRDSRSRLAALPRRCELEVSVRPEADTGSSFRNRPFDATPMGSGQGQ